MKKGLISTLLISLMAALALSVTSAPEAKAYYGNGYDNGYESCSDFGQHYYCNGYPSSDHSNYRRIYTKWSFWRQWQISEPPYNWWQRNWLINHHVHAD